MNEKRLGRPFAIAAGGAVAWLALSLAWSAILIWTSSRATLYALLVHHTQNIARDISNVSGFPRSPTATDLPPGSMAPSVAAALAQELAADSRLVYVMVWDANGTVLAHSVPAFVGTVLDVAEWPPLDAASSDRVTKLDTAAWPLPTGGVTDVTVRQTLPDHTTTYISVGFAQTQLDALFWRTQRNHLIAALIVSLGGVVTIIAITALITRSANKARRVQLQSQRARTSMLTERGMLASVLAHEVRSPLTALGFNLHRFNHLLATPASDPAKLRELTDSCQREIRRLDLMLNDFLHRTQVISPPELTAINTIIEQAVDFLRPAMEPKNVRVVLHLTPENPTVSINADELRQVILNLAANAQEAMPRGGTLAFSTLSEDNAITLIVRDSGTGIPAPLRSRLFEPFFTTKPHGSGLGLALVRRVISGAGGSVYVESEVDQGTTFRITLPRPMHHSVDLPPSDPNDETTDDPLTQPTDAPSPVAETPPPPDDAAPATDPELHPTEQA
jgi:signal transduction histidine kinase